MNEATPEEINLMDYIRVIRKRKWLIILGTLLCMVAAGVVSLLMPKVYEAKAYLMITPPKYQVEFASKEGSKISTPMGEYISPETFSKIILNEHTAKAVLEKTGLTQPPHQLTAQSLLGQVRVEYPRNTNLILLKVQDTSSDRAAQIANTWAASFIERNEEGISKDAGNTYQFVMDQLEKAKSSLKTAEEDLERFQRSSRIELMKEQMAGKIKQIVQYESRLDDLTRSQLTERARFDELTAQIREQERIIQPLTNGSSAQETDILGIQNLTAGMTVKEADAFIKSLTENALSDLTKAENEYKEFSQRNRIDILQSQVDSKVRQLADMKLRMTELEIDLEKERMAFEKASQELQKENKYIPIDKGLIGKEEINPLYMSLNTRILDLKINIPLHEKERGELLQAQEALGKEVRSMKEELATQRLEESRLKRRLALAESSYDVLSQKREQSKMAEAGNAGKERVIGYGNVMHKELRDALLKTKINMQSFHAEILQLKENIKSIGQETSGLKMQIAEQELIQTRLVRNAETAKNTFEILSKKGEETKISSAIRTATIRLSVSATPPDSPIKPNKRQNVMVAGVAGLLGTIMISFLLEFFEKNRKNWGKPA